MRSGSDRPIPLRPADGAGIGAAVHALRAGRLVLHPTETVVSLTGDPARPAAVAAARRLKGYRRSRPFLCLTRDADAARSLAAHWPEAAARLAETFWPGPLTLVLDAGPAAPGPVVAEGRVAVRPASDPVSSALIAAWGGPLFSTSANRRGQDPPRRVARAAAGLAGYAGSRAIALGLLPHAENGEAPAARASTVIDVTTCPPRLLRAGALSLRRIRVVVPSVAAGGAGDEP